MLPYTYFLKQIDTGLFYYGSQYNKNANPSDLWTKYFTSSNSVFKLIELYGKERFEISIRRVFKTANECVKFENKVIKRIINHPLCINGHYGFGVADSNKGRKIKDPKTGLSCYDLSGIKGKETKENTLNEDGLNIFQQAGVRLSSFLKNNPEIVRLRTEKMLLTKNKIGEDGLNSFHRAGLSRRGDDHSSKREDVKLAISNGVNEWIQENPESVRENLQKSYEAMSKIGDDGKTCFERHSEWMIENNPTRNTIWVNNGEMNLRVIEDNIPFGFVIGRLGFKIIRNERTCPYCLLTGKGPNMTRYHFEKCKKRKKDSNEG